MRFHHLLLASGAMLATVSAVAQTSPNQSSSASGSSGTASATVDAKTDVDGTVTPGGVRVEERDIVVTGTRFSQFLAQPQAKSTINAEERNLSGIGDIRALIDVQPGINYSDTFGLNVRGVGRQTPQTLLGQENTVNQYIDGFINLVPSNIAESTLFGGNVQFLRGPAGTTYGRNSLAGAVNLISRAPTPTFTGEIEAGGGRAGYNDIGINIAGPITSNLGFRAGAQRFDIPTIEHNLGTTTDGPAGYAQRNLYFEFQLEWKYRGFHIRNRATHFEYDNRPNYPSQGAYNVGTAYNPALGAPNNTFGAGGNPAGIFLGLAPNPQFQYAGPAPSQPYQINVNYAGFDRLRGNFQDIINADQDLGFANLVYVGGYQRYVSSGSSDLDLTSRTSFDPFAINPATGAPIAPVFAPGTIVPTDYRANYQNRDSFWSQELRLESKPGAQLGWVAGYYHFESDFNEYYNNNIFNATAALANPSSSLTVALPAGTLPAPNPNDVTFEQRNIYHIRSNALFGNATYDFNDHLRFDGGLRYTWDKKDAVTNFRFVFYYPPVFAADDTPPVHSATPNRADSGLSGRAAVSWRFTGGSQVYASYSRGYQSSAFTLGQGLPPNNIARSEHLDVYEIGGNLNLGRVRFDGSVFYQNLENLQVPVFGQLVTPGVLNGVAFNSTSTFTEFVNAPRSEIYGAELQATWHPTDHSNIVVSYTYLHPTFRNFTNVVDITEACSVTPVNGACATNPRYQTGQNVSGNEIPRTPRNKATIYGYYGINLGSHVGYLYPGGSLAYQDGFYTQPFQVDRFRVGARAILGLTLTYRTPKENFDLTGVVSNATRKQYTDNGNVQIVGTTVSNVSTYGQDQYFTVTGRFRF